jgi:hypothetical protein
MTDSNQNNLQLNIDYHVSTINTQVNNDLISKMQCYLYCVDNCIPDRPIPQLFIDYQNNIFPEDKFIDLVAYFFDYQIFKMLDSGLFLMSNKVRGNEFLDIIEEANIEKMLLIRYGIKVENSKIQELRKILQKTDILTIMIANPIWYDNNFFTLADLFINKSTNVSSSSCTCCSCSCGTPCHSRRCWDCDNGGWLY